DNFARHPSMSSGSCWPRDPESKTFRVLSLPTSSVALPWLPLTRLATHRQFAGTHGSSAVFLFHAPAIGFERAPFFGRQALDSLASHFFEQRVGLAIELIIVRLGIVVRHVNAYFRTAAEQPPSAEPVLGGKPCQAQALPPVQQGERRAQQVDVKRNVARSAASPEKVRSDIEHADEPGGDWDHEEQKYRAPWKMADVQHENRGDATGSSEQRRRRCVRGIVACCPDDTPQHDADEIDSQKLGTAINTFDIAPEHPEHEHIHRDVVGGIPVVDKAVRKKPPPVLRLDQILRLQHQELAERMRTAA